MFILIRGILGYLGTVITPIIGGLVGWIKYILPIGLFLLAIYWACETNKQFLTTKLVQYLILLIAISTIITAFSGNININEEFKNMVSNAYKQGTQNISGGALGAICAYPLIKLAGKTGTIIISIGVACIMAVLIYGIKPAEIVKEKIEEKKKAKEDMENEIEENIEENNLQQKNNILEEKRKLKENKKLEKEAQRAEELLNRKAKAAEIDDQIRIKMPTETNLFKIEEEAKEDKSKQVLTLQHALTTEEQKYEFPPIDFLTEGKRENKSSKKVITETASKLQKTLYSFGVSAKVENVSVGPTITRYELKPAEGVRVSKIASLSDDIALNLAATSIRIEAPIPGKQAVGIEIPNKENQIVTLREVIDSPEFKSSNSKVSIALGEDVSGERVIADIAKMPHLLIAGSTGSGKSVCINTLIASIIYKAKPSEVKLVMVDPKIVELSVYNGIPHLLIPVVTEPKKAAGALAWAVQEMEDRYLKFAEKGVRDIKGYNKALDEEGEGASLPQIVIIIDELADLMMVAAKDVEDAICRLAQKARAAGMHLVIATQRPSVDVITGLIKANIPSRIAFAVSSQVDSRTILDGAGAEKLLGKGDMLFYPAGSSKATRVQGAFISDGEVEKIVDFLKQNGGATYNEDVLEKIERANSTDKEIAEEDDDDTDPFLMDAIDAVIDLGQASASFIQRRFKVGYARAGRIIDQMEARGIISGYEGSKPRKILMPKERWEELKMAKPVDNIESDGTEE